MLDCWKTRPLWKKQSFYRENVILVPNCLDDLLTIWGQPLKQGHCLLIRKRLFFRRMALKETTKLIRRCRMSRNNLHPFNLIQPRVGASQRKINKYHLNSFPSGSPFNVITCPSIRVIRPKIRVTTP